MGRRRKKDPKRIQLCLRLTDKQAELLQRYADIKRFDSSVDAVRHMIDGLEDWLRRQASMEAAVGSSLRSSMAPGPSGLPEQSDVTRTDVASDVATDGSSDVGSDVRSDGTSDGDDDGGTDVGDFAGRPSVRLPEPRWNDGSDD